MRIQRASLLDVLTFILIIPFFFIIFATTGLTLFMVFGLDSFSVTKNETPAPERHIWRIIELPPVVPTETEQADTTQTMSQSEPEPIKTEEQMAQLVAPPTLVEVEPEPEVAPVVQETAAEDQAVEAEQNSVDEVEEDTAVDVETTLTEDDSDATDQELFTRDIEDKPVAPPPTEESDTIPQPEPTPVEPTRVEPDRSEPAPVPDASYFDKLLEQVSE